MQGTRLVNTVSSYNRLETRTVIRIFSHYGNENLGDEAIIDALILRIRKDPPTQRYVAFRFTPRHSNAVWRHCVSEAFDSDEPLLFQGLALDARDRLVCKCTLKYNRSWLDD